MKKMQVDIVIVAAGTAGLAAAVTAAEKGASASSHWKKAVITAEMVTSQRGHSPSRADFRR